MKIAVNLDILRKVLWLKKISKYKLAKLCGLNHSTVYSYLNKDIPIREKTCHIIADALEMPTTELFPDMQERPDQIPAGQLPLPQEEDMERKLTVDDMIVGSQTMVPEDGKTLAVRKVMNCDRAEFSGYTLSPNEQIIVKTGVSVANIDLDRVWIRAKTNMVVKNEIHAALLPIEVDKELCVVLHSFGAPLLLSKGMPFADIIFLDA